jgi:ribosomal protein S18 acetylase RimI-like enzyme
MQVGKARVNDVDGLSVFFRRAWEESGPDRFGFTGVTQATINEIASREFLQKRLQDPDVNIYIVKEEGKVLGFASTRNIDQQTIELSGIIMLESATGRGFGTQLVEKTVSSARQAGFLKMVVKTEIANERAIGFYKKVGFAEVGKARENVEGTTVETLILERPL